MQNLLGKIDISTQSVAMEIKDLDGNSLTDIEEERPTINLFGVDSDVFRNAMKDGIEEDENRSEKLLAACVESWVNIKNDDGQLIECSFDNALKLFKRYPIVMSQVDSFIAKRANYLKKP